MMHNTHIICFFIADAESCFVPSHNTCIGERKVKLLLFTNLLLLKNWETGTRTPIGRSRFCSPTIRRSPKGLFNLNPADFIVKFVGEAL